MYKSRLAALLLIGTTLFFFRFFLDRAPQEISLFHGVEMTIPYTIKIGHPLSESDKREVEGVIFSTFREIDNIHNKWNPASELSGLNRHSPGVPVEVSGELAYLLKKTEAVWLATEGKFDPTIEPLHRLWKINLEKGNKPPQSEIERVRQSVGWTHVTINGNFVLKEKEGIEIDLGGIAKGHLVDRMTDNLNGLGFKNIFVEWGGEIKATGVHPEGRPWRVFVSRLQDPNPDKALSFIEISDEALATSGDYLQQWLYRGESGEEETLCHIIDPTAAKPLSVTPQSICSCTVKMKSCAMADAVATAIMLAKNKEEAKQLTSRVASILGEGTFWIYSREDIEQGVVSRSD
ncbi:FAD:protein FMN transferase [Estrella lausannensis]|uniref:FAD:protein FMN transferase n=1 Tax=Estrella lausannensis TaxID=483423 RepID=A0A0H5DNV1_9BACT|nr:FAD:protein FMN transferase [Estrella lausannensis]CRX38071.1 Thiamine biosynthesis lipoprotein ApbE [Estrella lausannensis]